MRCETREERLERLRVFRERWAERAEARRKALEDIARDEFLRTDHHEHCLMFSALYHVSTRPSMYAPGINGCSGPMWLGFGEGRSFYSWNRLRDMHDAAFKALMDAERAKQSARDKDKHREEARREHEDALAQARERTRRPAHKAVQFLNRTHLWGEATLVVVAIIAGLAWLATH